MPAHELLNRLALLRRRDLAIERDDAAIVTHEDVAVRERDGMVDIECQVGGELQIDRSTRCLTVGGELVPLPARQFDLLAKLASRPTHVFPKDELLKDVWGYRSIGRTRTLDSHASRLRRRLAEATDTPYVLNIWGVGYRLMLPG